jgi:hypothetical protein
MCRHNWIFGTTMFREIGSECSRCHKKVIGTVALERYFNKLEALKQRIQSDDASTSTRKEENRTIPSWKDYDSVQTE